jgi:ATP-dependent Clp protease adapter protein ClpS
MMGVPDHFNDLDSDSPEVGPGTGTTILMERETVNVRGNEPMYKVLLHNDDKNDMLHVTAVIMRVFNFDEKKAVLIMAEAHTKGVAMCVVEPLEIAELRKEQLVAFSLVATIEPD